MRPAVVHGASRRLRAAGAALLVVLLAAPAGSGFLSGAAAASPPKSGWMENFAVAEPGPPAPSGELVGPDRRRTTLDALRGKVVLVNFWATWCGPCIRELPSLKRLHARLGGGRFMVLALSQDRGGWTRITPFLERHGLVGLPVYHDPKSRVARAAGVRGLPTTVLYDRSGRELGRLSGHAEWDSDEALALIRHYLDG